MTDEERIAYVEDLNEAIREASMLIILYRGMGDEVGEAKARDRRRQLQRTRDAELELTQEYHLRAWTVYVREKMKRKLRKRYKRLLRKARGEL